jgi:hypothetical protein
MLFKTLADEAHLAITAPYSKGVDPKGAPWVQDPTIFVVKAIARPPAMFLMLKNHGLAMAAVIPS